MKNTRRLFMTGLAAVAVTFLSIAAVPAAEVTWRMASKMPNDSPEGKVFTLFADLTAKYSGGSMEIIVYPNEQLGKVDAVLEQLKRGTVQMYAEGSTFMRKWSPDINWVSAAFLFDSREHWVRFMNGEMAKSWYAAAEEQSGITVLGDPTKILRGPYRVMVTKRDVKDFESIKGIKLRMHSSKTAVATWTQLGADAKTLAWSDVYQSIGKGIVEAVNSPIALVESMRFYEVAPHVVRHDEYYQSIAFMMNKEAYSELTDNQRAALSKAYDEAGVFSHEVMGQTADASILRMKAKGVTFMDIDRKPFIESMAEFYSRMENDVKLPQGFLDAVAAAR